MLVLAMCMRGSANYLPEALICCPNELLSSCTKLQLFTRKNYGFSEEIVCPKWISVQPEGTAAPRPLSPSPIDIFQLTNFI